jgi:NDP-sugar pyrophosphorylase family protein
MFKAADLFDLAQTEHAAIFDGCDFAWEALAKIQDYLKSVPPQHPPKRFPGALIGDQVFIGEGTVLEPGVFIKGPAIIGKNCQIRHNAYIRENVIVGDGCVIGNSSELKNALLFNGAQVPHFNYVGDSILGHKAHLGAGVKISNLKMTAGNIKVMVPGSELAVQGSPLEVAGRDGKKPGTRNLEPGTVLDTGLRKFGALLGDHAEAGCNAVLNPGSILGRGAIVYPNVFWRGVLPANMIAKNKAEVEVVVKRLKE